MTMFWTLWISFFTLGSIIGCFLLLRMAMNGQSSNEENRTTGHEYDGIEEYDNPLPRWWVWLFVGTLVFAVGYLALYPGLGAFEGYWNWTQENQWKKEVAEAEAQYAPLFARYAAIPEAELAKHPEAVKTGQRLFASNCIVCHGSAATGSKGFPNLTDSDWLYGGAPEVIEASILDGRGGAMPAWGAVIGESGVSDVANHVYRISGGKFNEESANRGAEIFASRCAMCHGAEGKGNPMFGAPNLTDKVWLYGGTVADVEKTIREGRNGRMPAHRDLLNAEQIHLIAAYVYSL